jgi:sugar/nucleoside kinase (ribokinase family)
MEIDVIGIGNAIVDVLSQEEDAFLEQHGLSKGGMVLLDADQAETLYQQMASGVEVSGGSVANSCAAVASLGGSVRFVGKVSNDTLGQIFEHDIRAAGVAFDAKHGAVDASATARCLILVTPDAQRTMNTYLGACRELGPDDIEQAHIRSAKVTYLEGYLWDEEKAKAAMLKAAQIAREAERKVALTLSDAFCVDRHRDQFNDLITRYVDILFANEAEILSLLQVEDFDVAAEQAKDLAEIVVLTRGDQGSVVMTSGDRVDVAAGSIERLVDTTGAGDSYAAGFLYGFTQGRSPKECAEIGSIAAAEIISHFGARPETPLASLIG